MEPSLARLYENVRKVIIGKDDVVRMAMTALLGRGHLLIEDAPGLGKTMLARSLAQSINGSFKRIQFTPDLLPTDVTGVSVFHPKHQEFEFLPGPVFTNVLLADEINRTSPRTQSSLLEAMEEHQVTVDGKTHLLPEPFFVLATQNPVELEGTYPLPEAQIDRFLMRLELGYPTPEQEVRILAAQVKEHPVTRLRPVLDISDLVALAVKVTDVEIGQAVQTYVVSLSAATRRHPEVRLGISPRGSLALMRAAQAHAFLNGLPFVPPDSVKAVAPHVLAHRLVLDPHREYTGTSRQEVVSRILEQVPVPTLPHGREVAELSS